MKVIISPDLINKSDISWFTNNRDLNEKIKALARKAELKGEQEKIEKLQTYDSSIFIDQSYFFNDGSQDFLMFEPIFETFPRTSRTTEAILAWQSRGVLNEKIRSPTAANYYLSPKMKWHNSKLRVELKRSCLKQNKVTYTPSNRVNIFTDFELDRWSQDLSTDFTLKDCFFGAAKLNKNTDPGKYSFSGYVMGFDSYSFFSFPGFDWGKNVVIFGLEIVHQCILIIRKNIY